MVICSKFIHFLRKNMSSAARISYSEKYVDEKYEYRHVMLPPNLVPLVPVDHLMTETEWRNLGVQQSPGWVHYMIHSPERHILLFRRPISLPLNPSNPLEG